MRLFSSISIEINSFCNKKCFFCPNSKYNLRSKNNKMPLDLITKIFKNLRILNYSGKISFHFYNEPLSDERLPDIISLCRKIVPRACINFATNSDLIENSEQIYNLFRRGLNQLQLNIYSNKERRLEIQNLIDRVAEVNLGNVDVNSGPRKWIYRIDSKFDQLEIINTGKIGKFKFCNRSGLLKSFTNQKLPINKVCTRPFRMMQINYKGNVLICCNDYLEKVICGNVRINSLEEIWYNEIFNRYRKSLLNKDRNIELCDVCDFYGGAYTYHLYKLWSF